MMRQFRAVLLSVLLVATACGSGSLEYSGDAEATEQLAACLKRTGEFVPKDLAVSIEFDSEPVVSPVPEQLSDEWDSSLSEPSSTYPTLSPEDRAFAEMLLSCISSSGLELPLEAIRVDSKTAPASVSIEGIQFSAAEEEQLGAALPQCLSQLEQP